MKLRDAIRLLPLLCLLQGIPGRASAVPASASTAAPIAQSAGGSTSDPAAIFKLGKAAMQSGQLESAEGDFRRVIALDPKSAAPHINLGVVYMRQKRWDEALVELKTAEGLAPNEPGIQLNIGLVYYGRNDFASAIEPFSAALQRTPDSLQARYLLGLCYFFTSRYQEATGTLSPLWDRESTNLNYLYVLSIAASRANDAVLQKRAFDQMLATGQNTPEFHLYVGKAWLAENETKKALEEFQAAESARPDLPLVHYFLGRAYLEQKAYPQAEAELQKEIAAKPEFAFSYEDLGILYTQLNQPEKAEQYFRQAIERNGSLANSWFGLAKLYREAGRYEAALDALDHAEALAPKSASVHYTRGQVLAHLGQSARAHEEFDTSSRLLKSFNDRIRQDPSGDRAVDAQEAAQQ